jgi:DNA-binding SARP family transcriptional activator
VGDVDRRHSEPAPFIRVLGPVTIEHARGSVEQSRRSRLTEYAAYLALHPGTTAAAIDEAIWPDRRREDNQTTRHTATSRLRAWLDDDPEGNPYLPVHQGTHYAFLQDVRTDWDDWRALLPNGPLRAPADDLEGALSLVRGRPFDGAHPRRYAWAEPIRRTMIDQIVDAAHELARHHAREGNWRGAEDAVVIGLALDPALERLWRVRILAAHANDANTAAAESIDRMLTVTDDLGGDLEPETEDLLAAIRQGADLDQLTAIAL